MSKIGIACKIHSNYVESANGNRSQLFDDAMSYTNDRQKALDIYSVIHTEQYKEERLVPTIQRYRNSIANLFGENTLDTIAGIKPDEVRVNNFRTFTVGLEDRNIARLRTFKFEDGYKIESSLVAPEYRGQGLGSSLYNSSILKLISEGQNIYSDDSLTEDSQRIWSRLYSQGIAEKTGSGYLIKAYPKSLDRNKEPKLQEVLKYIGDYSRQNKSLSFRQLQDVKNAMIGSPNLREQVTEAFYKDGVFIIEKQNLLNSGLYSLPEANNIISSIPLQNEIKSTIESYLSSEVEDVFTFNQVVDYNNSISEIEELKKDFLEREEHFKKRIKQADGYQEKLSIQKQLNQERTELEDKIGVAYRYGGISGRDGTPEPLYRFAGGRGTGHFGSGFYFLGATSRERFLPQEDLSGIDRERVILDISKYKLLRIRDNQKGYELHESLKDFASAGKALFKDNKPPYIVVQKLKESKKEEIYNEVYESIVGYLEAGNFSEEFKSDKSFDREFEIDWIRGQGKEPFLRGIKREADRYYKYVKNQDESSFKEEYNFQDNFEEVSENFKDRFFNILDSYIIDDTTEEERKEIFVRDKEGSFKRLAEAISEVDGSNTEDNLSVIRDVYVNIFEDYDPYDIEKSQRQTTIGTQIIKALGYNGIDVRGVGESAGMTGLDNTAFGTVIYDINETIDGSKVSMKEYTKENEASAGRLYRVVANQKNSNETSAIGTFKNLNPFIQEKRIVELLGGVKDREVFESKLSDSNFSQLKEKYFNNKDFADNLFNQMSSLSRLKEFKLSEDNLQRRTKTETKEKLEETLLTDVDNPLNQDIVYLQSLPNDIWRNNPEEITTVLESIRENAVEYGVDLSELENRYVENTQEEILDLLIPFKNLNLQPNERFMNDFVKAYDSFYNVDKSGEVKIENIKPEHREKTLIYLDTDLSEYELFNKHSLLKVQDKVYQKINKESNIDVLVNQFTQSLIDGNRPTSVQLSNRDNFEKSQQEVISFVQDRVANLEIPKTNVDIEELQKMVMYKDYFGLDFTSVKPVNKEAELQKFRNFEGDSEYLSTEFVADFQKEYIKEKQKNSSEFNEFFNHFNVSSRGIVLRNNDPISREQIKDYLSENSPLNDRFKNNFKQYTILSKSMDFTEVLDTNDFTETDDFLRDFYVNNPESTPKVQGQYTKVSENTIVAERNPQFVRTSEGVYEATDSLGDKTFYTKLPLPSSNYNKYGTERPELDVNIYDYAHLISKPENSIKDRKYYSQEELESINEERFSCQQ